MPGMKQAVGREQHPIRLAQSLRRTLWGNDKAGRPPLLASPARRVGIHRLIGSQTRMQFARMPRTAIAPFGKTPRQLRSPIRPYLATLRRPKPVHKLATSRLATPNLRYPLVIIGEVGGVAVIGRTAM